VITLGTNLESLKDKTPSPGEVLTTWGFGFHQSASGTSGILLPTQSKDAVLTAFGAPNGYGAIKFLLRVDRGDGASVYEVTLADTATADLNAPHERNSKLRLLRRPRRPSGPRCGNPVERDRPQGRGQFEGLQITATANGSLDDNKRVIPARSSSREGREHRGCERFRGRGQDQAQRRRQHLRVRQ